MRSAILMNAAGRASLLRGLPATVRAPCVLLRPRLLSDKSGGNASAEDGAVVVEPLTNARGEVRPAASKCVCVCVRHAPPKKK